MKPIYKILFILCNFLLLFNCSKEIEAESTFEPTVFIFGNIFNSKGIVTISVSKTIPLNQTETNHISDAKISLFTKDKNEISSLVTNTFIFSEGKYKSSDSIIPNIGNRYWIELIVDGVLYKSTEELLNKPIQINNVFEVNDNTRIEFSDPESETNFYLANVAIKDSNIKEYQISNDILFNGNENAFIDISIPYDSNNTVSNLWQLNYNTYQFYRNLISQRQSNQGSDSNNSPGRLFEQPPVNIIGNIINTATNKYALGNFGAISVND